MGSARHVTEVGIRLRMIFLSDKNVKARKNHYCSQCLQPIWRGTTYRNSRFVCDGSVHTCKEHVECAEAILDYMDYYGDGYGEGDLIDYMTDALKNFTSSGEVIHDVGDLSMRDRIVWSRITRTRIRQEFNFVLRMSEIKRERNK